MPEPGLIDANSESMTSALRRRIAQVGDWVGQNIDRQGDIAIRASKGDKDAQEALIQSQIGQAMGSMSIPKWTPNRGDIPGEAVEWLGHIDRPDAAIEEVLNEMGDSLGYRAHVRSGADMSPISNPLAKKQNLPSDVFLDTDTAKAAAEAALKGGR